MKVGYWQWLINGAKSVFSEEFKKQILEVLSALGVIYGVCSFIANFVFFLYPIMRFFPQYLALGVLIYVATSFLFTTYTIYFTRREVVSFDGC